MKLTETLATILSIVSFFLISESFFLLGFSLSLSANILWLLWAADQQAKGIFVVNACLAMASTNGLIAAIQVL